MRAEKETFINTSNPEPWKEKPSHAIRPQTHRSQTTHDVTGLQRLLYQAVHHGNSPHRSSRLVLSPMVAKMYPPFIQAHAMDVHTGLVLIMVITIMGLDPGTNHMGWGVVTLTHGREVINQYGVLNPKGSNLSQRLGALYTDLSQVLQAHPCHVVAMESVFVHRNVQSTVALGYARGIALAVAAHKGVPVYDYAPSSIKKGLTGSGRATKEQMQWMIQRLHGHRVGPDTADALAVALCHARHVPFACNHPS